MCRTAREGDAAALYRLVCELEEKPLEPNGFYEIYWSQLEKPEYRCWVWEEGGLVAGMLNLRVEWQLHHERPVAEILEFAVLKSHQGKGIGRALFSRALTWADESGCELIEVACSQKRSGAHCFYRALGMVQSHYRFLLMLPQKQRFMLDKECFYVE